MYRVRFIGRKDIRLSWRSTFDWRKVDSDNQFLAEYDGKRLIGLIAFSKNNQEKFVEVLLLEVSADYAHKGIGSNLLANIALIALQDKTAEGFMGLTSKTETVGFYNKVFNMNNSRLEQKFVIFPQYSFYAVKHFLKQEVGI